MCVLAGIFQKEQNHVSSISVLRKGKNHKKSQEIEEERDETSPP